jgi:3-deoxy-D-manno-octulosonic-acid transferase
MRLVYSGLFILLLPLIVLRLLLRSRRAPAYRQRLGERLGFFRLPEDSRPLLWVHAVSLGETLAARPLIERMLDALPEYRVLVTTTTPTGSAQVERLFGDRVLHVYAPWDTPGALRRFLRRARPELLVLMETELWPNMLHHCRRVGCQVVLANARLSQRSAAGYARLPNTTANMLRAIDWLAAQGVADAERFARLGMDPARMAVSGSIKFDVQLSDALRAQAAALRSEWALDQRLVLVFASTHAGEDEIALEAFGELRKECSDALLLLVPRHPERFESVYTLCEASGWRVARRSTDTAVDGSVDVLLVDTLGELLLLFGIADIAVIGGSFVDNGGHNPLEASVWGVPVLAGPSMFNFSEVAARLQAVDALELSQDADALAATLGRLGADAGERQRRGAAALEVMSANRGALDALFAAIEALLLARR